MTNVMNTGRQYPEAHKTAEPINRRRAHRLRKMVDDFLDHIRYVVRQEWSESGEEEITLAKERYHRLADQVWKLMVEGEHPMNCSCAICAALRD